MAYFMFMSSAHKIAVWKGIIFDSSFDYALKFNYKNLTACCGGVVPSNFGDCAFYFYPSEKIKKK